MTRTREENAADLAHEEQSLDDLYLGAEWEWEPFEHLWIYKPGGKAVGVVDLLDGGDCWVMQSIVVLKSYRRQGHGNQMMQAITALDSRPVMIIVDGFDGDTPDVGPMTDAQLVAWYERFGFRRTGECDNGCTVMVRDPTDFEDF